MEDLIEALTIFLKYKNEKRPTHCEHDVLMIMGVDKNVTQEDETRLDELGFRWNTSEDCWYSYKFGSA